MSAALILSSLGGIIAFATVIAIIIRAIFRQVNAVEDNTEAVKRLTESQNRILEKLNQHDVRIAIMEDRDKRHGST